MFASDAWESVLEGVVHEPDPMLADVKIRMVEEAIFDRIHDYSTSPGSLEEQALFDALGRIRVIRTVRRNLS